MKQRNTLSLKEITTNGSSFQQKEDKCFIKKNATVNVGTEYSTDLRSWSYQQVLQPRRVPNLILKGLESPQLSESSNIHKKETILQIYKVYFRRF